MVILDRGKHISSILIFLLEKGEIKKTDLSYVVSSPQTYHRAVEELEKEGYLIQRESIIGRKIVNVSLTPKGRIVAENLMHLEEPRVTIPEGLIAEIEKIIERDKSHSSVEEYVREAVRKALEKWKKEHAVG